MAYRYGASLKSSLNKIDDYVTKKQRLHIEQQKEKYELSDIFNSIPIDPQAFYEDMGCPIYHPDTGQKILKLAEHQLDAWKSTLPEPYGYGYHYAYFNKSNKIGLTTTESLKDFQIAIKLRPGKEVLLVAQKQEIANEHLYNLRKLIMNSDKYRKFLITKPEGALLRGETTKMTQIFLRNVLNPFNPSRIIALNPAESSSVSWKNVGHVHISDITKSKVSYDNTIYGLLTRLANTRGTMDIETIPDLPQGYIYNLWKTRPKTFYIKLYDYKYGIQHGIISQEYIDEQKLNLGSLFPNFFEGMFGSTGGNVFTQYQLMRSEELGNRLDYRWALYESNPNVIYKVMGIDPGFGSSKFGISIIGLLKDQLDGKYKVVVLLFEEHENSDVDTMLKKVDGYIQEFGIMETYIDDSNAGFVQSLLVRNRMPTDYKSLKNINDIYPRNIVPVKFEHHMKQQMLTYWQLLMSKGLFGVPSRHTNLIEQMTTAEESNFILLKEKHGKTYDGFEATNVTVCSLVNRIVL